ncbi:MAG TPA: hypothetical protein VF800_17955 [Telluria sp.]|jgi:hypothetical protein
MMLARYLVAVAALGGAAGCDILPAYRHPAGLAAAKVNLAGSGQEWICTHGREHALQNDAAGYADIPAGARLTVGGRYYGRGRTCMAATSFIPTAGQHYRFDLQRTAEHCVATVYIEDPHAITGLRQVEGALPSPGCRF